MPPAIKPVLLNPLAEKENRCHVEVTVCDDENLESSVKSESPSKTPESVPLETLSHIEKVQDWPLILPLTCCSKCAQSPNVPLPLVKVSAEAVAEGDIVVFAAMVLPPSLIQIALSNCSEKVSRLVRDTAVP